MTKISVIGGGLSGLAAASLLASEGFEVSVYERNSNIGGSFMFINTENHQFEFGPSFFTLPEVLESVFRAVGKNPDNYLKITKKTQHTKIFFTDGTEFFLTPNRETMIKQLQEIDPFAAERYDDFIIEIKRVYNETVNISHEFQINSWGKLVGTPIRNLLLKLRPFESLEHFLSKYFKNENLIKLFTRYANQNITSAKSIPAFNCALLYPLLVYDVFSVKGGNTVIPKSLKKLALDLGVKFYTEKEVTKIHIKNKKVEGIQINGKLSLESDYVLLSTSSLLEEKGILSDSYLRQEKSKWLVNNEVNISQFILFLGMDGKTDFEHHTILFSNDVEKEIEQISNGEFPESPTVYIYNSAFFEPKRYPGGDSLIVMATVPFVDENSTSKRADIATYKYAIFEKLKQHGFDLEKKIKESKVWTPVDVRNVYKSFSGEIHGMVSNSFAEAYIRPPVKSDDIEGLYFTFVNTSHPLGSTDALKNGMHLASTLIDDHNNL